MYDVSRNGPVMAAIFIVDDDDATRESLRFLLESEGFEVADFASGAELMAGGWPPLAGCLILDIHMPGMSGLDLLESLRVAGSSVPAIVVTGQADPAARARALRAGALDLLEKPLNDSRLLDLLRAVLDRAPPGA